MLTQEEKLQAFLTAIDDYAEKQRSRILSDLESSNRLAIEKAEKATLDGAHEVIDRQTAAVRMQVSRDLAARDAEARNELIRKRNAIEAEVFSRASDKLREYTKTDDYRAYLVRCASNAAGILGAVAGTVIFMRAEDIRFKDEIIAAFGQGLCSVSEDDSIRIGGLRFENDELSRAIDATYDSALYSQRDRFAGSSGLKVI